MPPVLRRFFPVLLLALAVPAAAQAPPDSTAAWRLVVDGRPEPWPLARPVPADSAGAAARAVLHHFQRAGYYLARVDSLAPGPALYLRRGPRVDVSRLKLEGVQRLDPERLLAGFRTRPGRVLDPERLEADLQYLLREYERAGRPLAEAEVTEVMLVVDDGRPGLDVTIRVEEGGGLTLAGLELVPEARTSAGFAAQVAGLEAGRPLAPYDPEGIRRELEATGLFVEVGEPELVLGSDGAATVRVPVEEAPPGVFDVVLGYLPPGEGGEDGALVGNGQLVLRNLFGQGRALEVELVRNPGRVAAFDLTLAVPFVLGLPLRLEAEFSGYQRDSTYQQQQYGIEGGYRFVPGLEVLVTARRERTEAGIAGAEIVDGRQRIPEADAVFGGVGVRFRRVDRPLNPRRGLLVQTLLEAGTKERELRGDSAETEPVSLRQRRLYAEARLFIPTVRR
ncbi:MAG: POTRA domain-containing protein, partial [Rhodothermales bacterium]|nr:POTRA domain-containing protein [Rhodothermales bacterium]